ncbi:DUF6115 domain-containing protein [Bacillus sp. FJAT-42315]|uniref:DUF6115 domain-containing protein n=1 Tax=Bacillus sp. FJAT-42315 TaxID=2014077 RepID=UPI000C242563|nr:hypothetical protein [Bacillus sp. FJAT-42315]
MTTLFIMASLILNAVALFAIILLFLRQNRLFDLKNQQQKMAQEMEEMMDAYLLEMKEENEKFIEQLSQKASVNEVKPSPAPEQVLLIPNLQRARAVKGYKTASSTNEHTTPLKKKQVEDEIDLLHKQGFTVEEIAKKLNKGKTEVELALKFSNIGKNS